MRASYVTDSRKGTPPFPEAFYHPAYQGAWMMLVTDLAMRDMESRTESLAERLAACITSVFRRNRSGPATEATAALSSEATGPRIHLVSTTSHDDFAPFAYPRDDMTDYRWRKHPQLRPDSNGLANLDPGERERMARSASIRGLFLARSGRYEDARTAFAMAAAEPSIDLTAIPGFWSLSRGGMQAAIAAYEDVERYRDASSLEATIRLKYRPRIADHPATGGSRRKTAAGT